MRTAAAAGILGGTGLGKATRAAAPTPKSLAETAVKAFHDTLSAAQKKAA